MYKISDIKSFTEADSKRGFAVFALLKSSQVRIAKNGSEFLMVEFGDNTGTFGAMCFDGSTAFAVLKDSPVGSAFEVSASADFYQGRFSPKIDSVKRIEGEELDKIADSLARVSPYNPEEMRKELFSIIETISDEKLKATVLYAIEDVGESYFKSVAAVRMHHAYIYGLLEHSLKVTRLADSLIKLYPFVDRDLAIAGCVLHDIGKVEEYSQGLVADRTRIGILHGHVVLGYRIVRKAGLKNGLPTDLLERLEHIILSHQGELEWGAAARAATPEAVFVSAIDNFDAKMGAVEDGIENANGAEFVEIAALRSKVLTTKPQH